MSLKEPYLSFPKPSEPSKQFVVYQQIVYKHDVKTLQGFLDIIPPEIKASDIIFDIDECAVYLFKIEANSNYEEELRKYHSDYHKYLLAYATWKPLHDKWLKECETERLKMAKNAPYRLSLDSFSIERNI